jgi:hypothetical protein
VIVRVIEKGKRDSSDRSSVLQQQLYPIPHNSTPLMQWVSGSLSLVPERAIPEEAGQPCCETFERYLSL